ncbi:MAG: NfeD family protein [Huintestinicola sp.]
MIVLWIILLVACSLLEAATFALVSIWFAVGALCALVAAAAGVNATVQWIIFLAVSVLLLIFTRPLLKKIMPKKYIPTNGELDIGKNAVVIEKIDSAAGTGRVRLEGVDWSAVSADGSVIEEGCTVVVKGKGAATLTVEKI